MKEWYCALYGQAQGPFHEDQVALMIARGEVPEETLVWSGSTPEDVARGWIQAGDSDLARYFSPAGAAQSLPQPQEDPGIGRQPAPTEAEGRQRSRQEDPGIGRQPAPAEAEPAPRASAPQTSRGGNGAVNLRFVDEELPEEEIRETPKISGKAWRCVIGGEPQGPYSTEQLLEMAFLREIGPDTLVWSDSTPEDASRDWRRLIDTELSVSLAAVLDQVSDAAVGDQAGLVARLAAKLLDIGLMAFPVLAFYFGVVVGFFKGSTAAIGVMAAGGITGLLLSVGSIYLLARYGMTIGKRAVGIRIVDMDGDKAPLWRIVVLRNAVYILFGLIFLLLPYQRNITLLVMVVFSFADSLLVFKSDRRTLHDMIGGTSVVKAKR